MLEALENSASGIPSFHTVEAQGKPHFLDSLWVGSVQSTGDRTPSAIQAEGLGMDPDPHRREGFLLMSGNKEHGKARAFHLHLLGRPTFDSLFRGCSFLSLLPDGWRHG